MPKSVTLILSIVLCEVVGIVGSVFTLNAIPTWYATLQKPTFSPPNYIFGPVWTVLYFLIGVSLYLVIHKKLKEKSEKRKALLLFAIQLFLNGIWTPIFFGLKSPSLGLVVIIALWVFIVLTIKEFLTINKLAGYLLLPYLAWVTFATLLNYSIYILNP